MSLKEFNNIDINELLKKMRERQDKTNERQRHSYLKRKEEGRNKQVKPKEEQMKRGPKTRTQVNIVARNNLSIILSALENYQIQPNYDTPSDTPINTPVDSPVIEIN